MSCRVPRDTIHALRFYSDIIGHEINLSGGRSSRSPSEAVASRRRRDAGAAFIGGCSLTRREIFGPGALSNSGSRERVEVRSGRVWARF
jgi:hypothetical protein